MSSEDQAALAAEGYYRHLAAGEYEQFVDGRAATYPPAYREQLIAACKQFMAQQERDHRGIKDLRVANTKTDTLEHSTNVFIVLCYGDSTNEEIVVPMVERDGRWRMK